MDINKGIDDEGMSIAEVREKLSKKTKSFKEVANNYVAMQQLADGSVKRYRAHVDNVVGLSQKITFHRSQGLHQVVGFPFPPQAAERLAMAPLPAEGVHAGSPVAQLIRT